ncbi:hypothetical protein DXG01_003865 [Tephrocybe rancida]|nr:hypothetical protein DXG01_003865 [Tephrocybe rancida]
MSTETKAKRSASTSNPPAEGDHRKSAIASVQHVHVALSLALSTGLCVYEVDDPSQRSDSQDESARLLKRVAELEGVIRELKNKPHPRWSQLASSPVERWHARSHSGSGTDGQDLLSDASSPRTSSENGESPMIQRSTTCSSTSKSADIYSSVPILSGRRPSSSSSQYYTSSPQSTPSPSLMTPTEEYARLPITIAGQPDMSPDYDLSSMFLAYPGLGTSDEYGVQKTGRADESCFIKQHGGHCGCLHESTNYSAVLELSIRLRRAADILARSPSHHIGSTCLLNQRVSDLDTFTTYVLFLPLMSLVRRLTKRNAL